MFAPIVRALVSVFGIASACVIPRPEQIDPFAIPRQAFFDSVHTVVVASASVVGAIRVPDSTLTRIEDLIEEQLSEVGLSVIPAAEYTSIWDSIATDHGGFFDPYTGERDEEEFGAAIENLQQQLSERFEFDALLYPEVWEVNAPFREGFAEWAGTTQLVSGGRGYSGDILAATLYVVIQDTSANELYAHEAGIELLEYMLRGDLTALPEEETFSDTARISDAVERALRPLMEEQPPPR